MLAIFDRIVEVFWGMPNSQTNYTTRNVQMNGGNREPIIWGLILGLLA